MPIGDLTAFLNYVIQILFSVLMATFMFVMVPRAAVSAGRIMEVLDTQPTIVDPERPVKDVAEAGLVEFRDVEFRYPGAEEPVLSGISFTAQPRRDHRHRRQHRQRQDDAHQPHPTLLRGHRRQRARRRRGRARAGAAGPVAPDRPRAAEVVPLQRQRGGQPAPRRRRGGRRAALALPRDRPGARLRRRRCRSSSRRHIAQGGASVSGGQRQRLAIARALAKQAKIQIYDDSFSALDFTTDAKLRAALRKHTADATVIIVAQRVGTIMHADQIIVLDDDGTVAGIGTHEQLLETSETYREIVTSQLGVEGAA